MSSVPPPYGPPPPQPPEEPAGHQPFDSYYRPQPAQPPRQARRGGLLGGLVTILVAAWAYGKYALLFLLKFGVVKTLLTLLISFGAYALFFGGPLIAAGLVLMILVHEMGHVVEIRRQGMQASAPLFIPFFGAAIFQRQHPTDALKQAQIGIAGPLAGTVGATVAFALYGTTHYSVLLFWAYLGFLINLFNLIPVGMLDGGWIMAVVSKWFQVIGLGALLLAVLFLGFSPIILVIILLGFPAVLDRFRNDRSPYYQSVPVPARLAMGAAWVFLTGYLAFAFLQTHELLTRVVG
jgi:Zn-dependent protease